MCNRHRGRESSCYIYKIIRRRTSYIIVLHNALCGYNAQPLSIVFQIYPYTIVI